VRSRFAPSDARADDGKHEDHDGHEEHLRGSSRRSSAVAKILYGRAGLDRALAPVGVTSAQRTAPDDTSTRTFTIDGSPHDADVPARGGFVMNIAVIGAAGRVGRQVLAEGIRRGHRLTASPAVPTRSPT